MEWLNEFRLRVKALLRRRQLDRDLRDELQFHLAMRAGSGALRRFGNVALLKESCRELWTFAWVETTLQDVRYGARMLRRSPIFTAAAVLSLALGIGANTAVFSLVNAIMLRTLPVKDPQELVLLSWAAFKWPKGTLQSGYDYRDSSGRRETPSFSYASFERLRAESKVFSAIAGFAPMGFGRSSVTVDGQAGQGDAELVTGGYFSGLGVSPILGRAISEADTQAASPPVAVISLGYWTRQFNRDPAVIGKAIALNREAVTIIGVAPPEFFGVQVGRSPDIWISLAERPALTPWGAPSSSIHTLFTSKRYVWLMMIARLQHGVSQEQARAVLEGPFQQSMLDSDAAPRLEELPHIVVTSAIQGLNSLRNVFSKPLWSLMIVVGVVLLLTCANVVTLLLARATGRRKEIGVRLAIGASRRRLIRQLLAESVLLAGAGGALGVLLAHWGVGVMVALIAGSTQSLKFDVHLDGLVLSFTAIVSMVTGMVAGLAPALRATQVHLSPALKLGAAGLASNTPRPRLGLFRILIVSQIVAAMVFLDTAGLFVQTLRNLVNQNLGFNRQNVLLFGIEPERNGYQESRVLQIQKQLLERLQSVAGVKSASQSSLALAAGSRNGADISIAGRRSKTGEDAEIWWNTVSPRFLETMGIPLLLGRDIQAADTQNSPKVALVNDVLAKRFLGGANPVGQRFTLPRLSQVTEEFEILGVVGNAKFDSIRKTVPPTVYFPYLQMPLVWKGPIHFEIRTLGDPLAFVPVVRRLVRELDPDLPLIDVKTQIQQIDETLVLERLFARFAGFSGVLALALACIGLHGTIAYAVNRRTPEIGIRLALGAQRGQVLRMMLRETLLLTGLGVSIGLLLAGAATRLVSSQLFGLKATDVWTAVLAMSTLSAVVLFAGYLPSRRAARLDPMTALRAE